MALVGSYHSIGSYYRTKKEKKIEENDCYNYNYN